MAIILTSSVVPDGLVVRIRRSHRRGRGSIPRLGVTFYYLEIILYFRDKMFYVFICNNYKYLEFFTDTINYFQFTTFYFSIKPILYYFLFIYLMFSGL